MSYVVLAFMLFTLVILALEPDTLKALYVSPVWLIILGVTYHVLYKPRMKRLGRELVNDHCFIKSQSNMIGFLFL